MELRDMAHHNHSTACMSSLSRKFSEIASEVSRETHRHITNK